MPVCKAHGKWPCLDCKLKSYYECLEDNEKRKANGITELHDLTELKKDIIALGGKIE